MSREGLDETAETRKLKRSINLFLTEKKMRIRKKGDDKRSSKTDAVEIPKGKITVKSRLLSNLGTKKFHPSTRRLYFQEKRELSRGSSADQTKATL